jgi:hypothetical protein
LKAESPDLTHEERSSMSVHHGSLDVFGGEDRMLCSMYVAWHDSVWGDLMSRLESAKAAAREGEAAFVDLNGWTFVVQPQGHRAQGGGPVYAFLLERGGIRISISKVQEPKGEMPNVLVDFGSLALMEAGDVVQLHQEIVDLIENHGAKVRKSRPGRADMCVDLPGVPVELLVDLLRRRCYKSRGRYRAEYEKDTDVGIYMNGRKSTGFTVGKNIMIRVYDKIEETKHDEAKRTCMIDRRWGGSLPEHATRVEIQIRREKLKELGVDTFEDYVEKRQAIVEYVTQQWLVFTDEPVQANHTDRCTVHPLWKKVQRLFSGCFRPFVSLRHQERKHKGYTKAPKVVFRSEGLRKQSVGCLLSILVGQSKQTMDEMADWIDELCSVVCETIKDLPAGYLEKKFGIKRGQFLAAIPATG